MAARQHVLRQGNMFYGKRQMFRPDFVEWFEKLRLPPYHLERVGDQYELTFEGSWPEVMMWEIPALAVLMELRSRAVLNHMDKFELQVLYARAMTKLWQKVETLRGLDGLRIADFGTRRRHSFLWQDWCVQAMTEGLGEKFVSTPPLPKPTRNWPRRPTRCSPTGTRNTRATCASSCPTPSAPRASSTTRPTGSRAGPASAKARGEDPREKMVIFSDGLDVDKIVELQRQFAGRVRPSFGWGTLLTNDFRGLTPDDSLAPFSLVCKAVAAEGKPTVKLSDNPNKAMGPEEEVERYKRVFHLGKQVAREVVV